LLLNFQRTKNNDFEHKKIRKEKKMSLRTQALSEDASYKFIDPISLDIMDDPVTASDGKVYERRFIAQWLTKCRSERRALLSPMTNEPLPNDILVSNQALKAELLAFKASKSSIVAEDIKFTLTSDIYRELDRISQIPELSQLQLQPPKIIVVGNESHGKSTLLERIVGLPLFPKDKGICTRCVIRVHLRRCTTAEPTIAEVSLLSPVAGHTFQRIAALDNIREKIQEAMQVLVENDAKKRVIIDDNEIVVKISLPYCLNVDILDLPGLVTTKRESSTQDLPAVTKQLALKIITENKDSSIFLLVNDIRVPPNQSRGCEVIQECKVQSKTLGVFTKLDAFVSEDGDETDEVKQYLSGKTANSFSVGNGWMATSSKRPTVVPVGQSSAELRTLFSMDNKEMELFNGKYKNLLGHNVGVQSVRQRIQSLYERFITQNWVPNILKKFESAKGDVHDRLFAMGYMLPNDPVYEPYPKQRDLFGLLTMERLKGRLSSVFNDITGHTEELIGNIDSDETFWEIVTDYHALFTKDRSSNAVNPYDMYHPHDQAVLTGVEVKAKFIRVNHSHYGFDRSGLSILQLTDFIPARILRVGPNNTFDIERTDQHSSRHPEYPDRNSSAPKEVGVDQSRIQFIRKDYRSKEETKAQYLNTPPVEGISRIVLFREANPAANKLKDLIRDFMKRIVKRLGDKLSPSAARLTKIVLEKDAKWQSAVTIDGQKAHKPFNVKRFPLLQKAMEKAISERLNHCKTLFSSWFEDFLLDNFDNSSSPSKIVIPEYFRVDGKVYCFLHLANEDGLEQFPHLILGKWSEIYENNFSDIASFMNIDDSFFKVETCQLDRIACFKKLDDFREVETEIENFAKRVRATRK
jgi:GTP-binding protein EngB required for normal cell division